MDQGLGAISEYLPPDLPTFHVLHQGPGDLLLIAALCGLSVLLILLWWLVVWEHLRRANTPRTGRIAA
jgi:hypothetical protein